MLKGILSKLPRFNYNEPNEKEFYKLQLAETLALTQDMIPKRELGISLHDSPASHTDEQRRRKHSDSPDNFQHKKSRMDEDKPAATLAVRRCDVSQGTEKINQQLIRCLLQFCFRNYSMLKYYWIDKNIRQKRR